MSQDKIYIVSHFHYDVAYLKTYEEYLPICFQNISEALSIMEEDGEYCFLIEQTILLEEYWNKHPEKRELLQRFAEEGRLAVAPGMYVMPDMNHPDGESLFLQARIGKNWLKEHLTLDANVCWIADCWGHHGQLPQILRKSGYNYYTFFRSMRRDVMKNDFIWQGLDGSEIKTHWLAKSYSGLMFPSDKEAVNVLELDLSGGGREKINFLTGELEKYGDERTFLLCNGGDFLYPQRSAPDVVRMLRERHSELSELQFASPEQVYETIDWDDKETFTGEFNSSFQGTFTTNIHIKQTARNMVYRLLTLESLAVIMNRQHDYTDIWKTVLKQQFHDIICGTICDGAYLDNKREIKQAETAADSAFNQLEDLGEPLAVYNPHSFTVNDVFSVNGKRVAMELEPFSATPVSSGRELQEEDSNVELPAYFENEFYNVRINENGYLSSLTEKCSGEELLATNPCQPGTLCLQMDYGDSWLNFEAPLSGGSIESALEQNVPDPYDRYDPGSLQGKMTFDAVIDNAVVLSSSSEDLIIRQQGHLRFWKININFSTTIHFKQNSPRIDYKTELMPENKHYRIRVAFPTTVREGRIRHEIPYGIQERWEGEHVAQNWMDYGDDEKGLALLNKGIPANNVTDDVMFLTLFRAAGMEYKTDSELSFNEGILQSFNYSIFAHQRGDDVSIIQQGLCLNKTPLIQHMNLDMMLNKSWHTDQENVIISCLRWSGDRVFVRLYEAIGQNCDVKLTVPGSVVSVAEADGLENAITKFKLCDQDIALKFKPFEVKSLLFDS